MLVFNRGIPVGVTDFIFMSHKISLPGNLVGFFPLHTVVLSRFNSIGMII